MKAIALMVLLVGCGALKPRPYVPEGEATCNEACFHIENDLPLCRVNQDLCMRLCSNVSYNNPAFATCLAHATDCPAIDACDK
jgi:hypothetical protein